MFIEVIPAILFVIVATPFVIVAKPRIRPWIGVAMFLYGLVILKTWDMDFRPNFFWAAAWTMFGFILMFWYAHGLIRAKTQ